jgi:O-acetyl-ADP-ribose deacetylase (regulator of RNase III)
MRTPTILGPETDHPYRAARAVLELAGSERGVLLDRVAFPGLGTGVGRVPPEVCARQMRRALQERARG